MLHAHLCMFCAPSTSGSAGASLAVVRGRGRSQHGARELPTVRTPICGSAQQSATAGGHFLP